MLRKLAQPVKVFAHKEHGSRLLFVNGLNNPRDMLGKNGVTFHSSAHAPAHHVVPVELPVIDTHGVSTDQQFNLNRNSLLNYIRACLPAQVIAAEIADNDLLNLLDQVLTARQNRLNDNQHGDDAAAHYAGVQHAGRHNTRSLTTEYGTLLDDMRGKFFSWIYQTTIKNVTALRKRFVFARTEEKYFTVGEILAKYRFQEAALSVPAYQQHLAKNSEAPRAVFADVPLTSKNSYIVAFKDQDWCIHDLKPNINFPLLFIWGRDSAVSYRGSKVSFTDLERAITTIDHDNAFVKRAFHSYNDVDGNEQFEIWVELKEGLALPDTATSERMLADILLQMGKVNQDLKYHLDRKDNAALPRLCCFTHGSSPISDAGGHRKQVLVFKKNNLPPAFALPPEPHCAAVTLEKADLLRYADNNQLHELVLDAPLVGHGAGSPRLLRQPSNCAVVPRIGDDIETVVMHGHRRNQ